MDGFQWRYFTLVLVCILIFSVSGLAVEGYSVSGSQSIETPTQNVTFAGQSYTLNSVSRLGGGENVTVFTNVPDDAAYRLNLRGPENRIISSERLAGDTDYTFSYFGPGQAGTYAATIEDNGDTVAVYPIIIAGYDVTVSVPEQTESTTETTISATITPREIDSHSSLDTVQVIVGNNDVEVTETMTPSSGNTYTATIDTTDIEHGTYNIYAVVRGDKTVRQRPELLGISDVNHITIRDSSTATPTVTETAHHEEGKDKQHVPEPSESPRTPSPTETAAPSATEQATQSNQSSLVTPVATTESTPTTEASGPGFTVLSSLLASFLTVLFAQYHIRNR